MVKGEMSEEISSVPKASGRLPSYMPTHMEEVTAMGTQYSNTAPVTISWSKPKNTFPSAYASTGMITCAIAIAANMGSG